MLGNILGWLILMGATVFFGWLAGRAWKARRPILKWGGVLLSGLLTLGLALVSVVSGIGLYKFYAPRGNPVQNLTVAGTPEQIQRGEHIANTLCVTCHTLNDQLPLSGGRDIGQDSPIPIGTFVSINLTPAGPLKGWADGEIFRTLREGVDREGRPLLVMSSIGTRFLSDEDLQAVIAYLRSQPPIANNTPLPADRPNLLGAIFMGAGLIPQLPPVTGLVITPPKGPTAEFGEYVARYEDCSVCHGEDLRGGQPGGLTPVGPNLRVVTGWTPEQFVTTLHTGVDPSGHALDDKQMPWPFIGRLDDDELAALYAYLNNLP
jgi:mono/diheme cytochrome c family protein